MDLRYIIALSAISIVSGLAVSLALAVLPSRGATASSVQGLTFESILLIIIGLSVLLSRRRIAAIQEKYGRK